jgi:hypothetical protein
MSEIETCWIVIGILSLPYAIAVVVLIWRLALLCFFALRSWLRPKRKA